MMKVSRDVAKIIIFLIVTVQSNLLNDFDSIENNYTIKKCTCEWNQIREKSGLCINHNITYVYIWDEESQNGTDVHLSEVQNVVVSPLKCDEGQEKITEHRLALLTTDGELLPTPEPGTYNYCIENLINADGSPEQVYEFCVAYEPFHLCCLPNETMNELGVCGEPHQPPPISYNYVVQNVQCANENAAHHPVAIENNLIVLKGIFGYYSESRSNKSCLAGHVSGDTTHYFLKFCECEETTCIESCCSSPLESYNVENASCELSLDHYDPINIEYPTGNIKPISRSMPCNESVVLDFSQNHHTILSDGSLSTEGGETLPLHFFCLGLVTMDNITKSTGLGCVIEKSEPECLWRFTIIQIFFAISSLFIVITIGVYLSVKDLRNRTGGACLISELIAMLISQVVLIIIQTSQHNFSSRGCLAVGVIEIIFILASFFWLNVMCYDMWTTFRALKPFSKKLLNKKLFLKYSIYAWGLPILIGIVVIIVEVLDMYPRPTFTIYEGCFFTSSIEDFKAQWTYLYGFIVILLVVNTFFFGHVLYKLLLIHKEQKIFAVNNKTRNQSNGDVQSAALYGKLFIIMGLPWIIEVFSSFGTESSACYLWILDIFNLLRGVLIFFIFVYKKSIRDKIMQTWTKQFSSGNTTSTSSSDRSRKTSAISLSSFLPSRKTSATPVMKPIVEDTQ